MEDVYKLSFSRIWLPVLLGKHKPRWESTGFKDGQADSLCFRSSALPEQARFPSAQSRASWVKGYLPYLLHRQRELESATERRLGA